MGSPGQEGARPPGAYIPPPLRGPARAAEGALPAPVTSRGVLTPPPPDCSPVFIMTAITHQDKWVLSQGRLESESFFFV